MRLEEAISYDISGIDLWETRETKAREHEAMSNCGINASNTTFLFYGHIP